MLFSILKIRHPQRMEMPFIFSFFLNLTHPTSHCKWLNEDNDRLLLTQVLTESDKSLGITEYNLFLYIKPVNDQFYLPSPSSQGH
jgi:hypothetical protein